jgi:predicted MFS family arabinose efflux permease
LKFKGAPSPLAPFAVRSFRYQWGSDLLTSLSFEMETLILGWYVLVETRSVVLLGVFGALQFLGSLLAPFTGVIGDRLGSRTMLLALRVTCAVLAVLIMAFALSGSLTPMLVLAIALVTGLLRPTEYMMRMALVGEIIPADRLLGAMGLSRINIDVARIAGALTGASLFAAIGLGLSYVFVSCFYALSVVLTLQIARSAAFRRRAPKPRNAGWQELKAGMAQVWHTPSVLAIMWLAFLVNLTAFPVTAGLLPYVAKDIYGINEIGLGHIVSAYSFGGLAGAILMSFWGGMANANRTMMVTTALWYGSLAVFAFVETKLPGIIVLFSVGLFQAVSMVTSLTALLNTTAEQYRARIMGVRMLAVYGLPVGLVASGYLINFIGFLATVLSYSIAGLVVTLFIGYRWRRSSGNESRIDATILTQ